MQILEKIQENMENRSIQNRVRKFLEENGVDLCKLSYDELRKAGLKGLPAPMVEVKRDNPLKRIALDFTASERSCIAPVMGETHNVNLKGRFIKIGEPSQNYAGVSEGEDITTNDKTVVLVYDPFKVAATRILLQK